MHFRGFVFRRYTVIRFLSSNMVSENREIDTIKQLYRRITCIVYHWKDKSGGYHEYDIPMSEYKDYESLKYAALDGFEDAGGVPIVPFL